jgi:hypothetical protein
MVCEKEESLVTNAACRAPRAHSECQNCRPHGRVAARLGADGASADSQSGLVSRAQSSRFSRRIMCSWNWPPRWRARAGEGSFLPADNVC